MLFHSSRREPGDWTCPQCNEVNFKSRGACRRCSKPRSTVPQSNPTVNASTPQIVPKPGDWTCPTCKDINFAARTACRKCGQAKVEPMDTETRAPVTTKPGDWKCSSCPEMNFGSRTVCRMCGVARPSPENKTDKRDECVICMENPIDSVISSCGHSAVCLPCGRQLSQCPMCRVPFHQQNLIKVFKAH